MLYTINALAPQSFGDHSGLDSGVSSGVPSPSRPSSAIGNRVSSNGSNLLKVVQLLENNNVAYGLTNHFVAVKRLAVPRDQGRTIFVINRLFAEVFVPRFSEIVHQLNQNMALWNEEKYRPLFELENSLMNREASRFFSFMKNCGKLAVNSNEGVSSLDVLKKFINLQIKEIKWMHGKTAFAYERLVVDVWNRFLKELQAQNPHLLFLYEQAPWLKAAAKDENWNRRLEQLKLTAKNAVGEPIENSNVYRYAFKSNLANPASYRDVLSAFEKAFGVIDRSA